MSLPVFAVVGHPNKGKSSTVATLAEDESVAISPVPGTTTDARRYTLNVDGEPHYVLVDTPGFQRPGELLKWLRSKTDKASERADAVAGFVAAHRDDPRFHDECELLTPLLEGAGILYVVDGAKPYGPEYELEMEILRWTGRPRMALINKIGDGDFEAEWRQALDQYFSIVRVFDALHADFEKRISLLRAFAELDEAWRPRLERAVSALESERAYRRLRSAREIAACLKETIAFEEHVSAGADVTPAALDALKARLEEKLRQRIRRRETQMFDRVQQIYRHETLSREETGHLIHDVDMFARENWEVFGLSRSQLAMTGAISGAAAGGGFDLAVGGTSLLLGTGIGALIGGAGAWFGSSELARVKTIAGSLGGKVVQLGPITSPNFPWVLLGRAWFHHSLVAERNHAYRDSLKLAIENEQNLMNSLPDSLRRELGRDFQRLTREELSDDAFAEFAGRIEKVLASQPVETLV